MAGFGGVGKEAITFLLTGDASDLIKTFGDVEKAADKSLGKTEDKIEKLSATMTKIGAVSMATGLSTALGLVQFIKDAEEAEEATNKFETAVAGMGSSIKTADIKKLAFDLQQVAQVTDEQVVAAARWGAVYGLTTRQLEQLLTAAVDLSAQTGKSLDVVTKQLAKAAAGEGYKGLTKLGLTFDETAYKADAFGTTVSEASEFAAGAAAKQTDTMSGQLTRLGNNWDNVKEQIGAGANEVFEPLARGAADLMENLSEANPELLKTVGHFTALGSLGMTGFGALATFAGQVVNIKEALDGLGLKLKNAEGGMSAFGKAAAGLGGVGAAFAIYQVADAINEAGKNTTAWATALNNLEGAKGPKAIGRELKEMADSLTGPMDRVDQFVLGFNTLDIGGIEIPITKLGEALEKMRVENPERLKEILPEVKKSLEGWDTNALRDRLHVGSGEDLKNTVSGLEKWAGSADKAAKATGDLTEEAADNADELKEWDKALAPMGGKLFLLAAQADQAAAGAKGFADALEGFDTDERVRSATDLGDAFHKVGETVKDLPPVLNENAAAMGLYNDEQVKAITAVTDWGDATKAHLDTLLKSGAGAEEVRLKTMAYTEELGNVMKAAGMSGDAVGEYLERLGLTPEDVETAIKLSGDEEAKWKLQLYHNDLVNLTTDQETWIRTLIDRGEYAQAWSDLQKFKNPITAPVWTQYMGWHGGSAPGLGWSGGGGWGRSSPAATGAAVVPMAAPAPAQAAPITINVTAGIGDPAEIGRKVIDAIRAAERVQGRGWRAA